MSTLLGVFPFFIFYAYLIVPLAPVVYVLLKWRSYRDETPLDPKLGMKVVLYYFKTLAYHVFLASLAVLFYGLLSSESDAIEAGLGLLLSSGILYLIHTVLIQRLSNTREFPLTARIYTGFNLIIVGLLGMISFVITVTLLFDKGLKSIKLPLACLVVYMMAWAFQTFYFCKPSLLKRQPPNE
jgi:hypothetical protein